MTEVVGSHQNPDKGELGKRILEDGLPAMFQFAQDEQCWRGTKLKKTPEIERTSLVQPIQFQDYSVTQEPEIDPDHFEELSGTSQLSYVLKKGFEMLQRNEAKVPEAKEIV